jgi:hypothetical protein
VRPGTSAFAAITLAATLVLSVTPSGQASLYGPWVRYASRTLGFQTLCVSDWRVIPVPNGVVFVMQSHPEPYVRMAVGRIRAGSQEFESSIDSLIRTEGRSKATKQLCRVGGRPAIAVEGPSKDGYSRDYYVDQGDSWYWISFNTTDPNLWPQYTKSFELILNDFKFL